MFSFKKLSMACMSAAVAVGMLAGGANAAGTTYTTQYGTTTTTTSTDTGTSYTLPAIGGMVIDPALFIGAPVIPNADSCEGTCKITDTSTVDGKTVNTFECDYKICKKDEGSITGKCEVVKVKGSSVQPANAVCAAAEKSGVDPAICKIKIIDANKKETNVDCPKKK